VVSASTSTQFFDALAEQGYNPLLARTSGTIRCDLANGDGLEYIYVAIDKGTVSVSHAKRDADAIIRCNRDLLDGVTSGDVNVMAALLRGVIDVQGDLNLLMRFQKVFPGPQSVAS
jgi:putative sterol carrier protein